MEQINASYEFPSMVYDALLVPQARSTQSNVSTTTLLGLLVSKFKRGEGWIELIKFSQRILFSEILTENNILIQS